jgi:5-methylcytosine-specific restriction enzyme A
VFEPARVYRRRDLHETYGGQRQGGISTPAGFPLVFLFTGASGEQYGYQDGWDDNGEVFRYSGEGQHGDMPWVRGNAAIRDHATTGKDLHLFEAASRGHVKYAGQMVYAGHELVAGVLDIDGHPRTSIVFRLIPIEGADPEASTATATVEEKVVSTEMAVGGFWLTPMSELLKLAIQSPEGAANAKEGRRIVRSRSEAVKVFVQRRAEGKCEGCGLPAPFLTKYERPYLEPHHTTRLSDGGPDDPAHVIALCPTCHRRVHHGTDGPIYNAQLIARARELMQPQL